MYSNQDIALANSYCYSSNYTRMRSIRLYKNKLTALKLIEIKTSPLPGPTDIAASNDKEINQTM